MYEIKKRKRKFECDSAPIITYQRDILSACELKVEAGTNGLKGGDGGHGSRTFIRLEAFGGADIEVQKTKDESGYDNGVELRFTGDAELINIIKGLKFITHVLEDQIDNGDED